MFIPSLFFIADVAFSGVVLVYLAPYSPDLNPIEEAFSAVKAWVRRNNALVREAMESPDTIDATLLLSLAVATVMTRENVEGWYRHSGYL
jgi:transposase